MEAPRTWEQRLRATLAGYLLAAEDKRAKPASDLRTFIGPTC